ncbi:MAG TPA: type I DNA topoisomerase [Dehalococcoidia bacterium]|nr:type I DNA topoisomerase [Dehalococcoidia bacterium]
MARNLVIVESPAKARTLLKILGSNYSLKASLGHIRDLPRSELGVDVENGFVPRYVVPKAKSKIVNELKRAVKSASTVYLATDPDREGEAIAWHLAEVTKTDRKPYRRVVFHEITSEAVKQAFQHPRSIDMQLVNAQQARRILDRLVGYKLSPLLWKKVRRGLSAGRVQSAAVKIVVDREREIQAFVPVEYWNIEAELTKREDKASFRAVLIGLMDGARMDIPNEQEASRLKQELEKASYRVYQVGTKKASRQPAPPFITSTLQQEAWRKLRFTAKQTMAIAQQLYEGLPVGGEGSVGLITYMRTDSTRVAWPAIAEARDYIGKKYGAKYLPPRARVFRGTVRGAQEAHEAIRPTRIPREPALIKKYLTASQYRLYDLIWKRMVASQMAAAVYDNTTVDIEAKCRENDYLLRATSSINVFPGFVILYLESKDEADEEEKKGALPPLKKNEALKLLEIYMEQRFTQPPPRFTEATLVKMLEQWGIGRPSTYAPILSTIQDRDYVTKVRGYFQPTELGVLVNDLLNEHFGDIVDIQFTAGMEDELDDIVKKNRNWASVVQDFYAPFDKDLANAFERVERVKMPVELTDELCPQCGKPLAIKLGRYGKFLACSGYPECKYTQSYQVKTGVKCPECGHELVERMSKKKRIFYGCSSYPECQFATFYRPLPDPCPKCGGLLTQYMGRYARCTKCKYRGKLEGEQ